MPRTTRHDILDAGFQLFFSRGYARVSMDDIAEKAGVTKRTIYHHFDSKDALIGAVLESQNLNSLREFQRWIGPDMRTPEDLVNALFDNLGRWARKPKWRGSGFTRIALELADLPGHPARKAARKHKSDVEAWLRQQLERLGCDAPARTARDLAICLDGAGVLALVQQDTGYIEDTRQLALRLVSAQAARVN